MERVLQYWDDLDDVIGAVGLIAERIRRLILFVASTVLAGTLQLGGIMLALAQPPIAMAIVTILLVTLMYRTVTNPSERSVLA
jgi:hypothetical protein